MQPLAYQDDISRLASHVKSTNVVSVKISSMMDQKGLTCHPTKTVCIAIGTDKYREAVQKEVATEPVLFGNFTVSFVDSEVYLGDVIAGQGLGKCVEVTINKRLAKVKGAMFKMKAIL